jgi:hypothetical protein
MRVSEFFKLERTQAFLDFVDVPIGKDLPVFLDPGRLRAMTSTWGSQCVSLLQTFFEAFLRELRAGNKAAGVRLLAALTERNEFHLGLSTKLSAGNAFGPGYALEVWEAMVNSNAAITGLLQDLEDTCLFIYGIGPDRISDAVCNIIRGPLIKYTQQMCVYYGIPMQEGVDSGPVWNPTTEIWEDELIPLPGTPYGTILFVPKLAVRHRMIYYDAAKYYRHFVMPEMQQAEKRANSGLVHTLRDGRTRVFKTELTETYGADKLAIIEQTLRFPQALEDYRTTRMGRVSTPMSHEQLASLESVARPNLRTLLDELVEIEPGLAGANLYEASVEKLLSALFFPSLAFPQKQHQIHQGRKRIDVTYVNNAQSGFFGWLALHYPSAHIFVECKNYGREVGNPEVDQIAGRFSPARGQVGLLVCRSVENIAALSARCRDTAQDRRGYVISLTDDDLGLLVAAYDVAAGASSYPLLREKFNELIM